MFNFPLILLILVTITGIAWFADKCYFAKQRQKRAQQAAAGTENLDKKLLARPFWLEYSAGLFPVIFIVFFLRSFLFEPFKIPSGSMIPTLLIGDFILVNKFIYGIRLPVINKKIIPIRLPERGEVAVFRYPQDPSLDYIKRIVGLPGDTLIYDLTEKRLAINGETLKYQALPDYLDENHMRYSGQFSEQLGNVQHPILVEKQKTRTMHPMPFPYQENCIFSPKKIQCKVPPGHYFAMGDNRDSSSDSRTWGFIPEENLVGKANIIWMNFRDLSRIGMFK